ncbi:MAG: hypothetical protein IJ333_01335 [Clostridia bacterium]|nr:hypothetical protein [Clostridia bacterium]
MDLIAQWFIQGIGILLLILFIVGSVYGMVRLFRPLIKSEQTKQTKKYYLLRIICIIIMITSWIFNFGWYRVILTWLAFPILHAIIFSFISGRAISKLNCSDPLKKYVLLSYLTYIITYLTFPDGGDIGPMYLFYGLIRSDAIASIAEWVAIISFIANVALLTIQLIHLRRINRHKEFKHT